VLGDYLERWSRIGDLSFVHPGEAQALHNLLCQLEKADESIFSSEYMARLDAARERLAGDDAAHGV
jgi:hypothetical protein